MKVTLRLVWTATSITTLHCCDRKSRAACAQSFALWQRATIEIIGRNLSSYCLLAPPTYIFVLCAHPVLDESHNQRNATGEVTTVPKWVHRYLACLAGNHVLYLHIHNNFAITTWPSYSSLQQTLIRKIWMIKMFRFWRSRLQSACFQISGIFTSRCFTEWGGA